jgi:hypothetical protein
MISRGLLLLLCCSQALALVPKDVPADICPTAPSLMASSLECSHNARLAEGAEACLARLNSLETSLGEEAARIAGAAGESQLKESQKGEREYAFSAESTLALLKTAERAALALETYHDHYLPPPEFYTPASGADPFAHADLSECEGGNRRRVENARREFLRKAEVYRSRRAESLAYLERLRKGGAGLASSHGKISDKLAKPAAPPPPSSSPAPTKRSTLTGIEEDALRRAPKK